MSSTHAPGVTSNIELIFKEEFKLALYSFQGRYDHSLSLDATIMVSKNWPTIGEHVVTIFVTQ